MALTVFTLAHVAISLVGIAAGFAVLAGFLDGRLTGRWTGTFLWTTIATSVTGFGFPVDRVLPSHVVGVISLIVLAFVVYARAPQRLAGAWRGLFVSLSLVAQYLNVFVLVVQLFNRVPALHAAAPTQSEPPFAIAQGVVLLLFALAGVMAIRRTRVAAGTAVRA